MSRTKLEDLLTEVESLDYAGLKARYQEVLRRRPIAPPEGHRLVARKFAVHVGGDVHLNPSAAIKIGCGDHGADEGDEHRCPGRDPLLPHGDGVSHLVNEDEIRAIAKYLSGLSSFSDPDDAFRFAHDKKKFHRFVTDTDMVPTLEMNTG